MSFTILPRSLALAAAALLASACSDAGFATAPPANPSLVPPAASWVTSTTSTTGVSALKRKNAILETTVSSVIGADGGSITVSGAGFTLIVPPNAVRVPTMFSVRALAGTDIAYEFEPHGARFAVMPIFKQDLSKANMSGVSLALVEGAYFANAAQLNMMADDARVDEFFKPITLDSKLFFALPHFSGYMVSSARR